MKEYIDFINKTFDHIYVITLHRASDRKVHFENELCGLSYTVFYGQDKLEFEVEDLKKEGIYNDPMAKKHHRYGKSMPAGMIGCAWSHQRVYKDIIEHNYHKVLILEDDIVINTDAINDLPAIFKEVPSGWDLIYFGFAGNEKPIPGAFFKKAFYHLLRSLNKINFTHTTIQNLFPHKITRHVFTAGYHDCTHAYAITLSAAKKLLALQTPVSFIADNLLAYACTNKILNGYIILPKMINQLYQVEGTTGISYLND